MTPDDLTRTSPPDATRDATDAALDAGLAAAFADDDTHLRPADPQAGTVIAGRYKLAEKIGEGGMGSVWVAHQTEPVKRKVAVKLIKAGMDSKAVLARFDAERQALAVMDHPNIAKVLDGGVHDGRPYFVMELVKGVPITEFADARKLTPAQRLELFVPVCQAIQHAHQKGVIHRDVKPGNVLVALYDDTPVPKVIDFGVAKATGAALTEHTLETGFGAVVGTPQYMSPEQATLNNLDIDTRSDVYALGVLLYELLTGTPPFSKKDLEQKGLLEVLRVVREDEPPRPSVKLSTADTLPSLAATRGTEPKKLTGLLRNELDWIVMKALEKDRTRRYDTVTGFAADVQRYLSGEPVQAHPPSTAYRLRKFVRKHRAQVTAAAVVLLALLLGIAGTSWGLVRADAERRAANDERDAKAAALQSERTARATARRALEEMTSQVMTDWLARQATLAPEQQAFLERALRQFEAFAAEAGDTPDERAAVADAHLRVGNILARLGKNDRALEAFDQAQRRYAALFGEQPDSPDLLAGVVRAADGRVEALHTLARREESDAAEVELLALAERLAADFPPHPTRLGLLWDVLYSRVGHLVSARRYAEAVAAADRLTQVQADRVAGREVTPDLAFASARTVERRHYALSWAGQSPTTAQLQELAALYVRAAAGTPRATFAAGVVRLNLTMALRRAKQIDAAFDEYARAERCFLDSISLFPGVPEYRSFLGALYLGWADLCRLEGKPDAADQARRAHATYAGLLRMNPGPKYEQGMSTAEGLLALAEVDAGRTDAAFPLFASAFARNERLIAARGPGEWTFGDLSFLHAGRAEAHERKGDFAAAADDWAKAAEYARKNDRGNRSDAGQLARRAAALVRGGNAREGVELADQVAKEKAPPAETLRHLASAYGWAAAGGHADAVRAVEALRASAAAGELRTAERLRRVRDDPAFATLRDRDDFKQLLADLEAKLPAKK